MAAVALVAPPMVQEKGSARLRVESRSGRGMVSPVDTERVKGPWGLKILFIGGKVFSGAVTEL